LNQLNRIAVAGLGIRKHRQEQQHEEAAHLGQALPGSKRMRMTTDNKNTTWNATGNHSDADSPGVAKTEAPGGLQYL
jgi:hypothetical protein